MTKSNANQTPESVSTRGKTPDYQVDLPAIMRQIRLCRSTLGAVLDELECGDRTAGTYDNVAECTTGVTGEIETLWEAIKRLS